MSLWHPTKPAYPIQDNAYDLGSTTLRWKNAYLAQRLYFGTVEYLYRYALGVLRTPNALQIDSNLAVGGNLTLSGNLNGWNPDAHASRHEYGGSDLVRNLDYLAIRGTTVISSDSKLQNIATVAQSLLPDAGGTYDLGSPSLWWRYIYPLSIRTRQGSTYAVYFESYDGTQYQAGATLVAGRFAIGRGGDIYPYADNICYLGSSSYRWAYFYAVNKSAAFKHPLHNPERYIVFKCVESPKVTVEDWGIAELKNGKAFVGFSEEFVALMSDKAEYAIFLTPEGECNGLYVSKKEFYGFEVKELNNGKSNIRFSWQVKAIRIGDEETPILEEPAPTEKREEWEAKRREADIKKEEDRLNRMKQKIAKYREVSRKS
jgi:hypothetical protein